MSRIANIPRVDWTETAEEAAVVLTDAYRTPYGTQELWPIQAAALCALADYGGALTIASVGAGKTITTALAPVVLQAQRPILLMPSKLAKKTVDEFNELRQHWKMYTDVDYPIVKYSSLGPDSGADLLNRLAPDLIVADESHKLRNLETSAVARRVHRYMMANPKTHFLALSGTFTKSSILDWAHLAEYALGDGSPLPKDRYQRQYLANATDVKPRFRPTAPFNGLIADYGPSAALGVDEARAALKERIISTPGIVISRKRYDETSLMITPRFVKPTAELDAHFEKLRTLWEAPDGWYLEDARQVWALARQMALGFYLEHDPRPPEVWADRRRKWTSSCRQLLEHSDQFDTVGQIVRAVKAGHLKMADYAPWKEIENTYQPTITPRWLSEHMLHEVVRIASMQSRGSIVFVEHIEFGKALSEQTGWPYYRDLGIDPKTGNDIRDSKPRHVIASQRAVNEGFTLTQWSRMIFTSPPTTNEQWEQCLGREHRPTQMRGVEAEYVVAAHEHVTAVKNARAEAKLAEAKYGQPQKILDWGLTPPQVPGKLRSSFAFTGTNTQ